MSRVMGVALLAALVLSGCSSTAPSAAAPSTTATVGPTTSTSPPAPTTSPSPSPTVDPSPPPSVGADPVIRPIPDAQWERMVAAGVWRKGCPVGRDGLRRVEVSYHDLAGGLGRGALVVNADVAESVARIFTELFEVGFPIERMRPIENYGGDDLASMKQDNTSAFNCRKPDQANSPSDKSPHANGRAVDVNPYRNPWQDPRCMCWQPSRTYAKKPRIAPGVITKGSPAWQAFTREGWIWQDISVTDYMHFDTGYPSEPFAPAG